MASTHELTVGSPRLRMKERCFHLGRSRRRVVLTGLGGLLLFWASWQWSRPEMARWTLAPGALVATAGLLLRVWATGWLRKNEVLARQGPYAYTRNPLYLGTFLLTLGHGLMSGVPAAPILFPALLLVLYWPTMLKEEMSLSEHFGEAFRAYQEQVPRLFPTPWPRRRRSGRPASAAPVPAAFHWPRVRRCYKGFIANALVITLYILIHAAHS